MGDSTSPGPRRSPRTPSGRLSFKSTSSASPTPRRISTPSRRTARARNAEPTSTPAEDAAETLASLQKTSSRAPDRDASDSPEDKDVHVVSTGIDTRSEAERGTEEWALKERREALNRARYEKGKARAQRVLERRATATSLRQRNKDEAVRKMKRLKYKERMKRREADAAEKAKVEAEKARKAEQASTRRRLERRKNLVSRVTVYGPPETVRPS